MTHLTCDTFVPSLVSIDIFDLEEGLSRTQTPQRGWASSKMPL